MDSKNPTNARLVAMIHNAPIGYWNWNMVTHEEWWSTGFFHLLKLSEKETTPSYSFWIDSIVHPEDKEVVEQALTLHFEEKREYRVKIRMRCGDEWKWYECSGEAERDDKDVPFFMTGAILDINDSELLNRKLKEQNEMLLEMSKLGSIGSWKIDLVKETVSWSDEVYAIHEAPRDKIPKLQEGINYYLPEYRELVTESVGSAIHNNTPFYFEAQIKTELGNIKWVKSIGKPVTDKKGNRISVVGVFQDISKEKKLQIEQENAYRIIEKQNGRLLNFAHIVSHNLRTHSGNMQMLHTVAKESDDAKGQKEILEMLHQASEGLAATIEDLTEVVNIQTSIETPISSLTLKSAVESILSTVQAELISADAQVEVQIAEDHHILFNKAYFDSVVLNLITNAIKYRRSDTPLKISIATSAKENGIELAVKDNGMGIDLALHEHKIFGMYKTFHNVKDSKGLGLFITKNQLQSLGADIAVESEVNNGSTFKVSFPN